MEKYPTAMASKGNTLKQAHHVLLRVTVQDVSNCLITNAVLLKKT